MHKPKPLVIVDKLHPEVHDVLSEVLAHYPRQGGNQVILSMSEACLDMWPITEADFNIKSAKVGQRIKLTLDGHKYPKLSELYRSLPRGIKGQAFLNLLNRHQMQRQMDPGAVTNALNAAYRRRLDQEDSSVGQGAELAVPALAEVAGGAEGNVEKAQPAGGDQLEPRPVFMDPPARHEAVPVASEADFEDPLAALPPMDFNS